MSTRKKGVGKLTCIGLELFSQPFKSIQPSASITVEPGTRLPGRGQTPLSPHCAKFPGPITTTDLPLNNRSLSASANREIVPSDGFRQRLGHQLRSTCGYQWLHGFWRSDSDKASSHAQSSHSGHDGSAGFANGTSDHQNVTKLALVRVRLSRNRNGLCVTAGNTCPRANGCSQRLIFQAIRWELSQSDHP